MPCRSIKSALLSSAAIIPGTIVNLSRPPEVGEKVKLGTHVYQVIEVLNLIPPRGDFHYIHATCRPLQPEEPSN